GGGRKGGGAAGGGRGPGGRGRGEGALGGGPADEAADGEGHRDGDAAQGELAQARAEHGPAGELSDGRPAGDQGHGCDRERCGEYREAEQVGQQRDQGAGRESQQGRRPREQGRGQVVRVDAEFLAGVYPQGGARVLGYGGGHAGRGVGISAVVAEVARQLVLLSRGEAGKHLAFERNLGVDQLVL